MASANWIELSTSEIAELQSSSWQIDCSSIVIKSRSQSPIRFSGPGTIYQTKNGELRFKLYVSRRNSQAKGSTPNFPAGQVIPDNAYFDLSATDHKGRVWKSERILLHVSHFFLGHVTVIDEMLFEIRCHGSAPKKINFKRDHLNIWIFDELEIPCNEITLEKKSVARRQAGYSRSLNAWKFRTLNIDFLLVKSDKKSLTVQASTELGNYPKLLEERVLEALQFLLGKPIPWIIIRRQEKQRLLIRISSKKPFSGKSRLLPPLPSKPIVETGKKKITTKYHRRLFESYLKHSLKSNRNRHPIWGYLNAVYEGGTSSFINSDALTLVVAIEGLVQTEFSGLVNLTKKDKKAISNLEEYVEVWGGDVRLKNRAKGAISQFYKTRVGDIMLKLESVGAITSDQRKNWEGLRHPSAHAFQTSSLSPEKMRELLFKVKVLFYHLIFYAIGYHGLYMNIGSLDWPLEEYNPKALGQLSSG